MILNKCRHQKLTFPVKKSDANFTIKLYGIIHPHTDLRMTVGLIVSESQFAPKVTVQHSWRSVHKLEQQPYKAGCRRGAGISFI